MQAEQPKAKARDEVPFKGVPSDQVGRGAGMDPPDDPGEDAVECEAIQQLRKEAKERGELSEDPAAHSAKEGRGAEALGGSTDSDIGSVQRPPADS